MSALRFLRINNREDPYLSFVKALYESAFPVQERREWRGLLSLIAENCDMHLDLVTDGDQPVAFVIWWNIEGWMFIEHFAVSSTERGKNYGSRIMIHYIELAKNLMILEVEPPLTDDAQRRIRFYERLGLYLLDFKYEQPSYREKGVFYPLCLMSFNKDDGRDPKFKDLVEYMKSKVYA